MSIFTIGIASGADDGYSTYGGTSTFNPSATNITIGTNTAGGGSENNAWFLFRNIPVPNGWTINSGSYLTVQLINTVFGTPSLNIFAGNVDNASDPSSQSAQSGAAVTGLVGWNVAASVPLGTLISTPSLSSILQTVVNRPGWVSGNSIIIYVNNDKGLGGVNNINVCSFEGVATNSALSGVLTLDFNAPPPPPSTISGSIPLFISTGCAGGLSPSGDLTPLSMYPSGHWTNSDGGSGRFWAYVNENPTLNLVDTTFITTVQSGFLDTVSKIWYSNLENDGFYSLKYYNTDTSTSIMAISGVGPKFCNTKEGWIISQDKQNNINIYRDNSNFGNVGINYYSAFQTLFNPGAPVLDMVYDRKKKSLFYSVANIGGGSTIYQAEFLPNGPVFLTVATDSNVIFNGLYIDSSAYAPASYMQGNSNSLMYACGYTLVGASYAHYFAVFNTSNFAGCITTVSGQEFFPPTDIAVDETTFKVYIDNQGPNSTNTGSTVVITLNTNNLVSPYAQCSYNTSLVTTIWNNARYMAVDGYHGFLYYSSGASLMRSNISGGGVTTLVSESLAITQLDLQGPVYISRQDFNLTQLPPGFGTTSPNEQVTNAYAVVNAIENFDWTNVYAKVLKQDLQTVIWENLPPTCGAFGKGFQVAPTIGNTYSTINASHNTLADWNNSVLRIESYSYNDLQPSGNFSIYSAEVFAFCSGATVTISSISGTCPLFCHGALQSSGNIYLFIPGQFIQSGIPLFIHGQSSFSGVIPLYISGAWPAAFIPLFMQGPTIFSGLAGNNFIPLFLGSTSGVSGVNGGIPLFMGANQNPNNNLPLFIMNQGTTNISGFLPLFIGGTLSGINGFVPLFLQNSFTQSGIPLFSLGGDTTVNPAFGSLPGGTPFSNTLPLYINRSPIVGTIPLFLMGQTMSGGLPLFIDNAFTITSGIPLSIPVVIGSTSGSMPINIVGW